MFVCGMWGARGRGARRPPSERRAAEAHLGWVRVRVRVRVRVGVRVRVRVRVRARVDLGDLHRRLG